MQIVKLFKNQYTKKKLDNKYLKKILYEKIKIIKHDIKISILYNKFLYQDII